MKVVEKFILVVIFSIYTLSFNEFGVNVGLTSINNSSGSKFNNYGVGVNYQLDKDKYIVIPRFDFNYIKILDFFDDKVDSLYQGSINGIYNLENETLFTPYLVAGTGYEHVSSSISGVFESHFFIQGGFGVNYKFIDGYRLIVEVKVLQIIGGDRENNEGVFSLGMSFPLVRVSKVIPPPPKPIVKKIIIRREPIIIHKKEIILPKKREILDHDRDGVLDKFDQCPDTPLGFSVDSYGCPIKLTLKVHFRVNSSKIEPYSLPKIREFADFLLKNRGTKVLIVGHTDSKGSYDFNLALSKQRAISVANKLLEYGVSPARIITEGKGESMPIASNETEEGRRLNRRIEAILIYPQ